jgi:hypothetical protein
MAEDEKKRFSRGINTEVGVYGYSDYSPQRTQRLRKKL